MPVKPSDNEEEYFAREQAELLRKLARERQAKLKVDEKEREKALHFMKCPKCGMPLEEIPFGDVRIDKCFNCEGVWLDNGELERIQKKEAGFMGKFLNVFRT